MPEITATYAPVRPDAMTLQPSCCAVCVLEWRRKFAANGGYDEPEPYGIDPEGYDRQGLDREGYDRNDRNAEGRLRAEITGYGRDGYDLAGFDRNGYSRDGYDRAGYNRAGYDRRGLDRRGFDLQGYDRQGYDPRGFSREGRDREGYDERGFDRYGYNREGIADMCDVCDNVRPECSCCESCGEPPAACECDTSRLLSYNYKPNPRFRGKSPHELYFGLEIEISARCTRSQLGIVDQQGEHGRLIYMKEDGSVSGFEAVTHPMTYDWAMANFPWEMLYDLEAAGCSVDTAENGIHIHVSRAGFSSPAHTFRWLKLWYRNQKHIERIAGRHSDEWATFSEQHREAQVTHVRNRKLRAHGRRAEEEHDPTALRYSAINTCNDDTFEIRVFASTLNPDLAKARLQLAASSVEYTRALTAASVAAGGWDWPRYRAWILDHEATYPELAELERAEVSSEANAALRKAWLASGQSLTWTQFVSQNS